MTHRCTCPACQHTARRNALSLFAGLAFEMAESALRTAGTLTLDTSMPASF